MTAAAGVVGADVEAAEAELGPVGAGAVHGLHLLDALDVAQQHDGAKIGEPVGVELGERDGVDHGVGVALLDLLVQLVGQVEEQGAGDLILGRQGDEGRDGDAIAQGDLARIDVEGELLLRGEDRRTQVLVDRRHAAAQGRPDPVP